MVKKQNNMKLAMRKGSQQFCWLPFVKMREVNFDVLISSQLARSQAAQRTANLQVVRVKPNTMVVP
jgi:hypothetical protein